MSLVPRARRRWRAAVLAVAIGGVVAPIVTAAPAAAHPFPADIPCDRRERDLVQANTDPLVVTTGIPGAPTYFEYGFPTAGTPTPFQPKAYMLVIHGGGWSEVGPGMVEEMRYESNIWRARGWATLNIDYDDCADSLADVFWYYTYLRSALGSEAVICATGLSAGGHLAMMLAGIHPDLDCAISQAAGLVLEELHHQTTSVPGGANFASAIATGAWGLPPTLTFASPHAWASNIGDTRMLIATAVNDFMIPLQQGQDYAAAVLAANPGNYVHVFEAPNGGPWNFGHGTTTTNGVIGYRTAEDLLIAPLV